MVVLLVDLFCSGEGGSDETPGNSCTRVRAAELQDGVKGERPTTDDFQDFQGSQLIQCGKYLVGNTVPVADLQPLQAGEYRKGIPALPP